MYTYIHINVYKYIHIYMSEWRVLKQLPTRSKEESQRGFNQWKTPRSECVEYQGN